MRKIVTKIVCYTAAAVTALGVTLVSACSGVYNSKPLDYTSSKNAAVSNGGFAVEKDGYVYYINGKEQNTAENTFGKPVKGAIMRISKDNLEKRNYSSVDTVVPQIAYSGNTNAGIFVYGDYVYYATPSTEKNSDGEVQNSELAFKRTKLDGTGTMKDYFVKLTDNSSQYRYVEVKDTVYLVYVAKESLYGTSYTNIHSVNTSNGVDTLLAYNVEESSVTFDSNDVTNPRVFYTMKVTDFELNTTSTYNQVYTVTADATTPKDYTEYFNEVYKDSEDGYDPEKDPKYVNCGDLVFDGIGKIDEMKEKVTVFNHKDAEGLERSAYTYSLTDYQNGVLLYTRKSSLVTTASLYTAKVESLTSTSWNPVTANDDAKYIVRDSSSASSYTYLFENGNISGVLIADGEGFIKTKLGADGVILTDIDNVNTFYMTDKQPTVLFTATHEDGNYIYYSVTGGNGYTVYRICYDGDCDDYYNPFGEKVDKYTPVQILDLDAASDWYKPELFGNSLLFPAQTTNMTAYPYIMVCDLSSREDGKTMMTNAEIKELTEKYNGINEKIEEIDENETIYKNLKNALRYAHYTGDGEYLETLIKAYVDLKDYGEEEIWSKQAVEIYKDFVASKGDWDGYADKIKVNGKDVESNKRDYYYALLGVMSEADANDYAESLKTTYLQAYPETEQTWFESLSTGAKVGFIIGVCAGGLILIGATVVVALVIVRKRKAKLPTYTKKRIKVDTTDDKNIDVYSDEQ